MPILGVLEDIYSIPNSGKIAVFGDSNCIDSSYLVNDCFDLLKDILYFIKTKKMILF